MQQCHYGVLAVNRNSVSKSGFEARCLYIVVKWIGAGKGLTGADFRGNVSYAGCVPTRSSSGRIRSAVPFSPKAIAEIGEEEDAGDPENLTDPMCFKHGNSTKF